LNVKNGQVDQQLLKNILQMKEFKYIMTENLKEFKEFYTEQVKNLASKFAQSALTNISETIMDFTSGKQIKSNN
jgi:hypothetical protein